MKRKIMFGCVLIISLLIMLPSISAIEYNEIFNENRSRLKDILANEGIEDLKIRILNNLKRIGNNLNEDIWTILWNIINDSNIDCDARDNEIIFSITPSYDTSGMQFGHKDEGLYRL